MKKLKFLAAVFAALVMGLGVYSCSKDNKPDVTNLKEDLDIQFRTNVLIGTKSIEWLDNFRGNIYENNEAFYPINDAVEGLNTILNIYLTNRNVQFEQYEISEKDYILSSNNGKISSSQVRQFYDNLVNDIASNMSDSNLTDRNLFNLMVEQKETSSNNVTLSVKTILGQPSNTDIKESYVADEDDDCPISVKEDECYLTAYGDREDKERLGLIGGGKCNGVGENETSAHEFVQTIINNQIPRGGHTNPKIESSYDIKYVNQQCWGIIPIIDTQYKFNNCNNLRGPDSQFPPTVYNSEDLSCAICIIKDILGDFIQEPNQLSFINLYTDKTTELSNELYWGVTFCWGESVIVPHVLSPDFDIVKEIVEQGKQPKDFIIQSLTNKITL